MYIPMSLIILIWFVVACNSNSNSDDTTVGEVITGFLLLVGLLVGLAAVLGVWAALTIVISDAYKLNPALVAAGIFFMVLGVYDEVKTRKSARKN